MTYYGLTDSNKKYGTHFESRIFHLHKIFYSTSNKDDLTFSHT